MNIDELRSVQSKERQTDSLQHLRESFYADVSAYISELEDERDSAAERAEDPFADPEVRRLTDEIETAREVVEAIYDRRLGKLVKRASLAAADIPADADGLTAEERELFDDLVDRIEVNKARVLDVLEADPDGAVETSRNESATAAGDAPTDRPSREADPTAGAGRAAEADPAEAEQVAGDAPDEASATGAGRQSDDAGEPDATAGGELGRDSGGDPAAGDVAVDTESPGLDARTTVRITGEVGEFYGVDDREYDLDREDVVTLPAANAEPLLQSGDAERVE